MADEDIAYEINLLDILSRKIVEAETHVVEFEVALASSTKLINDLAAAVGKLREVSTGGDAAETTDANVRPGAIQDSDTGKQLSEGGNTLVAELTLLRQTIDDTKRSIGDQVTEDQQQLVQAIKQLTNELKAFPQPTQVIVVDQNAAGNSAASPPGSEKTEADEKTKGQELSGRIRKDSKTVTEFFEIPNQLAEFSDDPRVKKGVKIAELVTKGAVAVADIGQDRGWFGTGQGGHKKSIPDLLELTDWNDTPEGVLEAARNDRLTKSSYIANSGTSFTVEEVLKQYAQSNNEAGKSARALLEAEKRYGSLEAIQFSASSIKDYDIVLKEATDAEAATVAAVKLHNKELEKNYNQFSTNPGFMEGVEGLKKWEEKTPEQKAAYKLNEKKQKEKPELSQLHFQKQYSQLSQSGRQITININGGLIHTFTVHTASVKESAPDIKRIVEGAILDALKDAEIQN